MLVTQSGGATFSCGAYQGRKMDPQTADNVIIKYLAELMWVLIAMIGGIARSLDGYIHSGVFPKVGMLVAHGVVSGFSGYMVAQVMLLVAPAWVLVGAGVGGYLGTQGLDWIASILKTRFGGEFPASKDGEPK